jgi:phenylacetic acid degradation protein
MSIYEFEGIRPVIAPDAYVHPAAVLIGDVIVGPGCFIGPCASLRGDLARITIGEGSNIQDGCIIHSFPGGDVVLEAQTHIGHGAVLHGCHIGRGAMVGIQAVVMDRAVVGEEALVAAMAFVKGEMQVPARTLAIGIPARIARPLRPEEIAWRAEGTRHYQHLARRYRATLRPVEPMDAVEPERPRLPDAGPAARPPG